MQRQGSMVRRSALIALGLLCYVLVFLSEPSRQLTSDGDRDHSDQSEDSIRAVDPSEASILAVDQSEARVASLRSVWAGQPPAPQPPGPGVETVLLPGQPPVTVCVPHKVSHYTTVLNSSKYTRIIHQGGLARLGGVQQEAGRPLPGEDGEAAVHLLDPEGGPRQEGRGGEASPGQTGQRLQDDLPGTMVTMTIYNTAREISKSSLIFSPPTDSGLV